MTEPRHWLVKSEEDVYPITQLEGEGSTLWDGVRNAEARNLMRDRMRPGDLVLYYHSNANPPGVVGLARVETAAVPDPLQFDPKSPYFDATSDPQAPRWLCVRLGFYERFPRRVSLPEIKAHPGLQEMVLLKRMRLSVQPVEPAHFALICQLGHQGDSLEEIPSAAALPPSHSK
jgi:predicted RNA-binding protein with PUA-like domain